MKIFKRITIKIIIFTLVIENTLILFNFAGVLNSFEKRNKCKLLQDFIRFLLILQMAGGELSQAVKTLLD